jgi:cation:H+ antiporter
VRSRWAPSSGALPARHVGHAAGRTVHTLWSGRRDQDADLDIDVSTTVRDLAVFLIFFSLAGALGFIDNATVKVVAAVVFVLAYAVYVWRTLRHGGEADEDPKPLYFDVHRSDSPPTWAVVVQVVAGIALIVGGAELFVREIESIALAAGISPSSWHSSSRPLATELPEKVNSVIWSRRGQDALALGNISGAMVFQSMIPVAVGLAFTRGRSRHPARSPRHARSPEEPWRCSAC